MRELRRGDDRRVGDVDAVVHLVALLQAAQDRDRRLDRRLRITSYNVCYTKLLRITDRFLPDKAIDLVDEAAARIKMEIDSKPESMDRLDRRLIQLRIEREAIKKETDEASKKRLTLIEEEIARLEKEYSDLEEVWKAEKASYNFV